MIEPMILPRLVWPAAVIAATIVAEAMLQCKAGRRTIPLGARKLKAEASAGRCTKITHRFRMPLNDGSRLRGWNRTVAKRKLPAL